MSKPGWLGKDLIGGVPSQSRPDRSPPPHWRLDSVYAIARPHHLSASPDGSTVAFVLDIEGTTDLWALEVESGSLTRLTTGRGPVTYWEDTAPVWSPDGDRLAYNSQGYVCVVPVFGGPSTPIIPGSAGVWLDGNHMVVAVGRDRTSRLATLDLDDPWPAPFGPNGGDVGRARLLPDGRVAAVFWPRDDRNRSDIVVAEPAGDWATLVGHPDRRADTPVVSGSRIYYTLEHGQWAGVFTCDLDGTNHLQLASGEKDFSDLTADPAGDGVVAVATSRGRSDLVRMRIDGQIETVAEGGTWQTPVSVAGGIVAVHEAADAPPRIVLVRGQATEKTLFDGSPAPVRAAPHSKLERVSFQSLDGLEIEGFLMRPADVTRPVPAIVYPHGGPTAHYGDEWDGHAQYFVDKGYAWFAINFRGSTSYGLEFERGNHGQWAIGDVDDCVSAAHHLGSLGWVDANRIAIYGPSYGSYLAVASLVRKDNPFACAVARSGDSDLLTSWAQGEREGIEDLERMMGHPSLNRDAYVKGSPINEIGGINRPILVVHGERDPVVPPSQSEHLVDALDRIGATYEYVTYPLEGHGLLRRDSHLHFYRRMEQFLDWYLM